MSRCIRFNALCRLPPVHSIGLAVPTSSSVFEARRYRHRCYLRARRQRGPLLFPTDIFPLLQLKPRRIFR